MKIEQFYKDMFNHDVLFQSSYQDQRIDLYLKLLKIIKELSITSIIDMGCAYGLFIEICNQSGVDAFGFDLPIENLKNFHQGLRLSNHKFFYGTINDEKFQIDHKLPEVEAFSIFDVLRHI